MNDVISRQDAIDAMCSACGYDCDKSEFVYDAPPYKQVIICPEHYALSTLPSEQQCEYWDSESNYCALNRPSAQPRKKGKWIYKPNIYGVAYCSECDFELHINDTPYCPNCGAEMVKGEEDE